MEAIRVGGVWALFVFTAMPGCMYVCYATYARRNLIPYHDTANCVVVRTAVRREKEKEKENEKRIR